MMLNDKIVVVTGAGSGIGRACVERFRAEGATVEAWDRDPVDTGGDDRIVARQVDVSSAEAVGTAAAEAGNRWGGVDVLVNCAGVITPNLPAQDVDPRDYQRNFDVNLMGVVHTTRELHAALAGRSGAIVNVASQAALVCLPHQSAYSAIKGAVAALTRSLAIDWASEGVRVNAVCPGFTRTPMATGQMTPELEAAVSRRVPLGRIFEPEEIAASILFLASDMASAVTGVVLPVDGGWTAGEPALPM
ncbi:SDR family NAD(P)-dependent oxidoreductase [Patulibacter sp.]|uniref:SDR family NAD(P)-dependent oxidoreductase n=1 Tax=Patulibacter sp. TaxID=1912859 RepID=UPI002723A413|nr:SDR family oxidoreductase [Patulibacter sp.]MDO9407748.1 SDR family oxidoreductase [Patulibacter sp.]